MSLPTHAAAALRVANALAKLKRRRFGWLVLLALLMIGCSKPPALPAAASLMVSETQLAQLPYLAPGTQLFDIHDLPELSLPSRRLNLRVLRPRGPGPWPTLLFSHGFASAADQYDAVLAHWASHGYLILAPQHADAGGTLRGIWASLRLGKAGLITSRYRDLLELLDTLPALNTRWSGAIDLQRVAVAGHSFGAFSAQQLGGALALDASGDVRIGGADPRIRAVVAISPPGEMFGLINQRSWLAMDTPMLASTGTWDVDGRFVTDWRQHRLSFDSAPASGHQLLVIEGADHYLGKLICRTDREAPPQTDALRILNAVSSQFLAQHLGAASEQDVSAIRRISGGFAWLESR